jgi:hypothetical protein
MELSDAARRSLILAAKANEKATGMSVGDCDMKVVREGADRDKLAAIKLYYEVLFASESPTASGAPLGPRIFLPKQGIESRAGFVPFQASSGNSDSGVVTCASRTLA